MDVKQKPSGIWFVEYLDDHGKRRRVSTGIKTEPMRTAPAEAKIKAREIVLGLTEPKARSQRAPNKGKQLTMRDLFDRAEKTIWAPSEAKSQASIRSNVKILDDLIGDVPIEDMTFTRLEQLVEQMKEEKGYAPGTIKRKLDMVSKALRMATRWTDADGKPLLAYKPPMPTIRVANLKDRVLSRAEEAALFNAIEKRRQDEPGRQWFRIAALVRFLLDTGARLGEALGLTTKYVEVRKAGGKDVTFATFPRYLTKNDKPRTLPLTQAAVEALDKMRDHLGPVKREGQTLWRFFAVTPGTAWYMFNQLRDDMKDAGFNIDDVTLHTLRHTALTRLAQGGMGLLQLQNWAGHSDPKITAERYTHLQPTDLMAGASILGKDSSSETIPARISASPTIETSSKAKANRAKGGTISLN